MENFDILLQVEDLTNYDGADIKDMIQQNEKVRCGMGSLAQYGGVVGFNSTEFQAACDEAYENASYDVEVALASSGIYDINDFIPFVIGFAYAEKYFNIF